MFRLTLKELGAKKLRLLTTAIAVMLGVAFMAGTLVLTATIGRTFDGLFQDSYAGTDAYVRGTSAVETTFGGQTPRLDAGLVTAIGAVPGVAAAEAKVSGYAQLIGADGNPIGDPDEGAPTFGESWMTVADLNPYRLSEGHAPASDTEIVIDRHSADVGDLVVGESVSVLTKAGAGAFTIAGIATFGDADSMGGASAVLFTQAEAQRLVAEPGKIDAIAVVGAAGVSQEQLKTSITTVLPKGTEALTGAEITAETQGAVKDSMAFFNTFLMVFAVIALFVGAFIIFNTFSIIVAQRQKEMAMLRAIGASRQQVTRSVLVEAVAVGLVASVAGIAAGIGIAGLLKVLLGAFGIDIPAGGLVIGANTIIVSLVVGLLVTVVSAVMPARRAGRVPPVAAMRAVALDRTAGSRTRLVAGLLVTGAGIGALFVGLNGDIALVGFGAVTTFIGVSVLAPVMARPAARVIGWPLARFGGMTGSLARENAMRNPKRTASTAAALMIGVGLVGFITTFGASAKASVNHAVDKGFNGDFVLEAGGFQSGGVSHELAAQLAAKPELSAVTSFRSVPAAIDGANTQLGGWDAATVGSMFDIEPKSGDVALLGADGIAMDDDYAASHGYTMGSKVPVRLVSGSATFTVKAIYGDSTWTGSSFVDQSALNRLGLDQLDQNVYAMQAVGVSDSAARAAVDSVAMAYPTAPVMDRAEFKADRAGEFDTILNLVYALLGLAIVIALIGITNTLALSIFERTRELGLLRAVGMTRGQLRSTVRGEAVIIALFGTVLGLGIGLFFGWSMVQALKDEGFTELSIPVVQLAVVTLIAAVAGIASSLLPARRAAKLDILGAIATG